MLGRHAVSQAAALSFFPPIRSTGEEMSTSPTRKWAGIDRPYFLFTILLVLSLTVRIAASLGVGLRPDPSYLDVGDEHEYYSQAAAIVQGHYELDLRRPVGYVAIEALFQFISLGSFAALQLLNAAVFSLVAPLTYLLVWRVAGNRIVAVAAGLAAMLWPPFIYYGRSLYSETATLPLFVLFLALIPRGSVLSGESSNTWWRWTASGAFLGLCTLFRPMYMLFFPFLVLVLLLEERKWRTGLRRALLSLAGFAIVVSLYSVVLSIRVHAPVIVSTTGGEALAEGLNPALIQRGYVFFKTPDGRSNWSGPGKLSSSIEETGYLTKQERALPGPQVDRLLRRRVIEWAISDPRSVLYLQASKLLYMWGIYPIIRERQLLLLNMITLAAVITGLISLVLFRNFSRGLVRFWVLPVYSSTLAMISWGSWRFREPGDLGIIAIGALLILAPSLHRPGFRIPTSEKSES
jgi:4-amino-4-deoxy-L-arabinose transferase-like glycosyltransferase